MSLSKKLEKKIKVLIQESPSKSNWSIRHHHVYKSGFKIGATNMSVELYKEIKRLRAALRREMEYHHELSQHDWECSSSEVFEHIDQVLKESKERFGE